MSYVFPPPAFIPLVLSKFLLEHVTSQSRLVTLVAPCLIEVPWLATVLNMLEDVPHQCPIIKDLIADVLVGWLLKGLPLLHLTCLLVGQLELLLWRAGPDSSTSSSQCLLQWLH